MNNRPPLSERFPVEVDQRAGSMAAKLTEGWSNWLTQVFLCLPWKKGFNVVETLDFANTGAQSQSSLTVTIAGVRQGDAVQVAPLADVSGVIFTGVVTADNTVTVYAKNFSSGAVNPASQLYRIIVLQN